MQGTVHNVAPICFQEFKQKVIRQMSFSSLSLYRSTQICSNCHFDFIIEEVRVEMYTLHNDVKRAKWLWKFGTNAKVDERWGEIDNITSNNFDHGLGWNNGQIFWNDAMVIFLFSGGTIVFDGFSMVLPHQDPHYPLSRKSFFLKAIGGNEG